MKVLIGDTGLSIGRCRQPGAQFRNIIAQVRIVLCVIRRIYEGGQAIQIARNI